MLFHNKYVYRQQAILKVYVLAMRVIQTPHHVVVKALVGGEVLELFPHPQVPLAHNGSAVAHCLQTLSNRSLIQGEPWKGEEKGKKVLNLPIEV